MVVGLPERCSIRRIGVIYGALLLSLLFQGTMAVAAPEAEVHDVVKAIRFEVVDAQGRTRAVVGVGPSGEPHVALLNEAGKCRALLSIAEDKPALFLYSRDSFPAVGLGFAGRDEPVFFLNSPTCKSGVWIDFDEEGLPRLTFRDAVGEPRAILGYDGGRDPRLLLSEEAVTMPATEVVGARKGAMMRLPTGCRIVADDGTFLGELSDSQFASDSISNRFGSYGNKYSAVSIFNQFGTYGSKFAPQSPWNKFSATPPRVMQNETFIGYLTVNETLTPRLDPYAVCAALKIED